MGQGAYDVRPTSKLFMKIVVGLITTQFSIQVELGDSMPITLLEDEQKLF
jgi:hypothetical protein